jgi:DHA2 family multidrug resistance protein
VLHAPFSWTSVFGLSALNAMVTQQAVMIAYNDDFKLMGVMTLAVVPLVLLLRPRLSRSSGEAVVVE